MRIYMSIQDSYFGGFEDFVLKVIQIPYPEDLKREKSNVKVTPNKEKNSVTLAFVFFLAFSCPPQLTQFWRAIVA